MFEQAWKECVGCCKMTMFRDNQGRAECIECAAAQIPTIRFQPKPLSYIPRTKNTAKFMKGTK